MNIIDFLDIAAKLATAVGIFLAFWQLRRTRHQTITSFEDQLAREYRQLARKIPVAALLGQELPEEAFEKVREEIYNYIDLSNEQVFLRQNNRISETTWLNWCEGIQSNLSRPIFIRVWEEVKNAVPESFQELRRVEREQFESDPLKW